MSSTTCQTWNMSLRHAILGLLAEGPASGYGLTKQFDLSLRNVWSARHSQIYPELQKMAEAGWVRAGAEGARGRREYDITDEGRAELHRWLTSPLPERAQRNETLLRAFFLWTVPVEEAIGFLEATGRRSRDALDHLEALDAVIPWDDGGSDLMGRLVLEQGRRMAVTMAEWSDWAVAQLEQDRNALTLKDRMPVGSADGPSTRR